MTNYNDGKIHGWNGGECPVHPKSVVRTWFRYGATSAEEAGVWCWSHGDDVYDIVAFQVVMEYVRADRIEELEAKLAEAVETLKRYGGVMPVAFAPIQDGGYKARTTLAELTGGNDE